MLRNFMLICAVQVRNLKGIELDRVVKKNFDGRHLL
jgi:hypothetical protein